MEIGPKDCKLLGPVFGLPPATVQGTCGTQAKRTNSRGNLEIATGASAVLPPGTLSNFGQGIGSLGKPPLPTGFVLKFCLDDGR